MPAARAAQTAGGRALLAWGYGIYGQLGNGAFHNKNHPVKVQLPSGTSITRAVTGYDFSVALTSNGSVLTWGDNSYYQLAHGTAIGGSDVPVKARLPKGTKIKAVSAGCYHVLALTSGGSVLAWGYNYDGELGNGHSGSATATPVKVKLPKHTKVVRIAAGCYHSLALTSTGKVLAWGQNSYGELGNGSSGAPKDAPVKVKLPQGVKVHAIAADYADSMALTSTGEVLAWGYNAYGELGNGHSGSGAYSALPVKVKLPKHTKAVQLASGAYTNAALSSKGSVFTWGYGYDGELGNGTTGVQSDVPVKVSLPTKATAIGFGAYHGVALSSAGAVFTWGDNTYDQLGNGHSGGSKDKPVKVSLPKHTVATQINAAAYSYHTLAMVRRG